MSKSSKNGKSKVHKLTEAEYAAYITSLKTGTEAETNIGVAGANVKLDERKEQNE